MPDPSDYTIGWICAITTEYVAAQVFLDEEHGKPDYVSPNDKNNYTLGKIGNHNIVIAVLPNGEYGTASAAAVATHMLHSFPNVRIVLMVGIGGGAPSLARDIRLGDVVVGTPCQGFGGVFQYDFGKAIQGESFKPTRFLNQAPEILRAAVSGLQAQYEIHGHQLESSINEILGNRKRMRGKYQRPPYDHDRLYESQTVHPLRIEPGAGCVETCDSTKLILRRQRTEDDDNPMIHYGLIGSANQLMKDALTRDRLASENGVLCFEMEAAGLMNSFPCLVIRGICDYADSHKNKQWQGYAAMTAAAYAKDLLQQITPSKVEAETKLKDIVSRIQEDVQDISQQISGLKSRTHSQEIKKILDWLSGSNYYSQRNDLIVQHQKGTGNWFLESKEFQEWREGQGNTLFCPGDPGAGKTMITSIVINHLLEVHRNNPSVGIAFVYCNFQKRHEQQLINILSSMLEQFSRRLEALPQCVIQLYEDHGRQRTRPSLDVIVNALAAVIKMYSQAFVMIDALDEYQDSNLAIFLSQIFDLQRKTDFNLLTTSRRLPSIEDMFRRATTLKVQAMPEDVESYIGGNLHKLPAFVSKNHGLVIEITNEIVQAAGGMFLLAMLHLESLKGEGSAKQIRKALQSLATGDEAYRHAYDGAMQRIISQHPKSSTLAMDVLSWITFARRPLTPLELQHALAVEFKQSYFDNENLGDLDYMLSLCAGLVTIDRESNIVRMVHYTTYEYFDNNSDRWFKDGESRIARVCITYLCFDDFETGCCEDDNEIEKRLEVYPLYDYAVENWGEHAYASSIDSNLILNLLESKTKVSACSEVMMRHLGTGETCMTGGHLAAWFGLVEPMSRLLLTRCHEVDSRDRFDNTPLLYAIENGHEAMVKLLLDRNADIESKDYFGETPLLCAVLFPHEAIAKILLDRNANIESKDDRGETPLSCAVKHESKAMVKLLLDHNADIESKDRSGRTPLLWAARYAHVSTVELLLENGADADTRNNRGRTPLSVAVDRVGLWNDRHVRESYEVEKRKKLMLQAKKNEIIKPDSIDQKISVSRLLLSKGVDVNTMDEEGRTPLSWAAANGYNHVIKLLLESGANANLKDNGGRSPLSWAIQERRDSTIALLQNGVDTI